MYLLTFKDFFIHQLVATMDLPEGEYDPDFMVLDLGENVQQREANFVNVMVCVYLHLWY